MKADALLKRKLRHAREAVEEAQEMMQSGHLENERSRRILAWDLKALTGYLEQIGILCGLEGLEAKGRLLEREGAAPTPALGCGWTQEHQRQMLSLVSAAYWCGRDKNWTHCGSDYTPGCEGDHVSGARGGCRHTLWCKTYPLLMATLEE